MVKPVLVFGYGNPSRGDDALGPMLLDYLEGHCDLESVELLTDFQLQIENALDLEGRELVLFADASASCRHEVDFTELQPARDKSYTTHAMSPEAVLDVYRSIKHEAPPPCFLLAMRGERFELGEPLSAEAEERLEDACRFAERLLQHAEAGVWRELAQKLRADAVCL